MAISTLRCAIVTWAILLLVSVSSIFLSKSYIDGYRVFKYNRHSYATSLSYSPVGKIQTVVANTKLDYRLLFKRVNIIVQNKIKSAAITSNVKQNARKKLPTIPSNKSSIKHLHYYNIPKFIRTVSFNLFKNCEYKCRMTSSRSPTAMAKSDAVIFFGPRLGRQLNPPLKRKGQIWIFHSKESTANYVGAFPKWKNLFNWTMTFRRDSDILAINGFFPKRKNVSKNLQTTLFSSKSKSIAWFASNCETPGKREKIVKRLNKALHEVITYGACGWHQCPRSREDACMDILREKFKFYLAFENSLCYDYITEKSYKLYEYLVDTIPIVRGVGNQYSIYLPPNSYIDTEKFASVSKLSSFIKKVQSNKTLFESFFKWKPYYEAHSPFLVIEFCDLCRRVHHADKYKRLISDVGKWIMFKNYKNVCRSPKEV